LRGIGATTQIRVGGVAGSTYWFEARDDTLRLP
jgi:hypothetical protein